VRRLEAARASGQAIECFLERASLVGLVGLIHFVDKSIKRHGVDDEVLCVARATEGHVELTVTVSAVVLGETDDEAIKALVLAMCFYTYQPLAARTMHMSM